MQRNEVICDLITKINELSKDIKQENIYLELESKQFLDYILAHLAVLQSSPSINEYQLVPLKRLLQTRLLALGDTAANFHVNEMGAANLATVMISKKLSSLMGDDVQWVFHVENPAGTTYYYGSTQSQETWDKIAMVIIKRCFDSEEPNKTNAVKLAEALRLVPEMNWANFLKDIQDDHRELAKQLCNGFLQTHFDIYASWPNRKELFRERLEEGIKQVCHDTETARIYFFLFFELYYRLRVLEPEFKTSAGALFGQLNRFTKVVSTREDKLQACRGLQQFLTSKSFSSLHDSIEQYFSRQHLSHLYKETQSDFLGMITAALCECAKSNQAERKRALRVS